MGPSHCGEQHSYQEVSGTSAFTQTHVLQLQIYTQLSCETITEETVCFICFNYSLDGKFTRQSTFLASILCGMNSTICWKYSFEVLLFSIGFRSGDWDNHPVDETN